MDIPPEVLTQLAQEWDPTPFANAMEAGMAQKLPIMGNSVMPNLGANPQTGAPGQPFNFAQMLMGAGQQPQLPGMPPGGPIQPPPAQPVPMPTGPTSPQMPRALAGVPSLAQILGRG